DGDGSGRHGPVRRRQRRRRDLGRRLRHQRGRTRRSEADEGGGENPDRAERLGRRVRRRLGVGVDGTVSRIDPATNTVVAKIKAGSGPRQVRYGAGAIWVGNATGRRIWRIDPATNKARAVPIGLIGPDSLAVSDRAIWVSANSGSLVVRVDPRTLKVVARVNVGFHPGNAAIAGDGSVFVPVTGEGTVVRIAGNRVVGRWHVGSKPFPATFAFGDVWVPVSGARTVVRFHVG